MVGSVWAGIGLVTDVLCVQALIEYCQQTFHIYATEFQPASVRMAMCQKSFGFKHRVKEVTGKSKKCREYLENNAA